VFNGTVNGPRIKTDLGGGGFVRNITYENIVATNVQYLFYVTMSYATYPGPTFMHISDVLFRNVTAHNVSVAGVFDCLQDLPCLGITMQDVVLTDVQSPYQCEYAYGTMDNVQPPACLQSSA
jgi:polygalacturonase